MPDVQHHMGSAVPSVPWPWGAASGVAAALNDPGLWAALFDDPNLRKSIKIAAKRSQGTVPRTEIRGLPIADDDAIGDLALRLVQTPIGRKCIEKAYEHCFKTARFAPDVAQALYTLTRSMAKENASAKLPDISTVGRHRHGKSYVIPGMLAQWIRENPPSDDGLLPLALYCCAFAILQPNDARAILDSAIAAHPALADLLMADASETPLVEPAPLPSVHGARALVEAAGDTVAPSILAASEDRLPALAPLSTSPAPSSSMTAVPDLSIVQTRRDALVTMMRGQLEALASTGRPFSETSLHEALEYRASLTELLSCVRSEHCSTFGSTIPPVVLETLEDARAALLQIAVTQQRKTESSLRTHRDHIARSRHIRCESQPELIEPIREAADRATAALDAGQRPEDIADLSALATLLSLVEHADELDDSNWDGGIALMSERFGQSLARAAARRRLHVAPIDTRGQATAAPDSESKARFTHPSRAAATPSRPECDKDGPHSTSSHDSTLDPSSAVEPLRDSLQPVDGASPEMHLDADTARNADAVGVLATPSLGEAPPPDSVPPESDPQVQTTSPSAVQELVASAPSPPRQQDTTDPARVELLPAPASESKDANRAPWSTASPTEGLLVLGQYLLRAEGDERQRAIGNLAFGLLRDDQAALAWHLLRSTQQDGAESVESLAPPVPAPLALALLLSTFISRNVDDGMTEISECYETLLALLHIPGPVRDTDPGRLLVAAASLRPALVAPGCFAADVLRDLEIPPDFEPLSTLRRAVCDFASHGHSVSLSALTGIAEHESWSHQLAAVQADVREWLNRSRLASIIYAPTTDVWHKWLQPHGPLGLLLEAVLHDRRSALGAVQTAIEQWGRPDHTRELLRRTDHDIRGRKATLRPIEARALQAIDKKVREAIVHLAAWRDAVAVEPEQFETFTLKAVRDCRDRVLSALAEMDDALQYRSQQASTLDTAASVRCLARAVAAVRRLFDANHTELPKPPLYDVMNGDLLLLSGVQLNSEWSPTSVSLPAMPDAIAEALIVGRDWEAAFDMHCEAENFESAERVIEHCESAGIADVDLARLRRALESRNAESIRAVEAERSALLSRMHRMVFEGILGQSEYQELGAAIGEFDTGPSTDLRSLRKSLSRTRDRLDTAQREHLASLEARIERTTIASRDPGLYARIGRAIADGDLRTAEELLVRFEHGEGLPDLERPSRPVFLPTFIDALEQEFVSRQAINPETVRAVRERRRVGPIAFTSVPPVQAKDIAHALDAWQVLRGKPSSLTDHVDVLLREVGFELISSKVTAQPTSERYAWLEIHVQPVNDGLICPIPRFGSEAHGRYRVLLLWGKPVEADILKFAFARTADEPVIVLYLGQMSTKRRRDLAHRCRKERKSLLVLDEYLVLYLSQFGARSDRLSAFFNTTLPFTAADPYTTTAGFVPTEMFFGREEEARKVIERNNVHLVYGGRQLGKTALLRQLERLHNAPSDGRIVRWIDLTNAWGIGLNRPASDIWQVIAQTLRAHDVIAPGVTSTESIEKAIRSWLGANEARRIVLLLDEADLFMQADAAGLGQGDLAASWVHTRRLKSLSDQTDRRFKFVFAGLHNVQRSARDPNSPIAHLGQAVCIGPFLSTSDLRDAHEMILRPFGALGYQFASPDLVMAIMAYTNYYPSLIQLFCKQLLEHVSGPRVSFDARDTPPYLITSRHIHDTYQSRSLHTAIVERFNWTLDLDARYRVIALLLAVAIRENRELLSLGQSVTQIRDECLRWWHVGFANDPSVEGFVSLLEEMVGLGVLRDIDGRRFTLRSPNVLRMLGTEDQLLAALDQVSSAEPRVPYDPAAFRREHPAVRWRRSPLTARQENEICGASSESRMAVLFGSDASGAADVATCLEWLRAERDDMAVHVAGMVTEPQAWLSEVDGEWRRAQEGVVVVVVPATVQWDDRWLAEASHWLLNRRKGGRRQASFLFQASLAHASTLLAARQLRPSGAEEPVWNELALGPWHQAALRQWLDRVGIPDSVDSRRRIQGVTGGWHRLVQELGRRCEHESHDWSQHLDALEQSLMSDRSWFDSFGLSSTLLRVLRVYSELGEEPLTVEDLCEIDTSLRPVAEIELALRSADHLRYATRETGDRWRFDPVLVRLSQRWGSAT